MSDARPAHDPSHLMTRSMSRRQAAWLLGLLAAAVVLAALGGETARLLLRYERAAVLQNGEYWRLLTGHLVHLSTAHLAVNLAGLAVLAALFPRHFTLAGWLWISLLSLAAIDVGFVWYQPQLQWYVGLSGVLHGVLAAGAIAWWRHETKYLALALSVIVIAKLTWEQWQGPLPLSGDIEVVVVAHLYGAVGGAVAALLIWGADRRWPWSARPL